MKRNYFIVVTLILITISFLISTVISIININDVTSRDNKEKSELIADAIYTDIHSELERNIIIGRSMAANTELIDLALREDEYSYSEMEKEMKRVLGKYTEEFGCNTAFLVTKGMRYYTGVGFNKVVSPKTDAHDVWYPAFVNTNKPYEFNIDVDEVNNRQWTVFINVRLEDDNGNLIGVCGIGTSMNSVQSILSKMQEKYDIEVTIVDNYGNVQVTMNDDNIDKSYDEAFDLDTYDEDIHYTDKSDGYIMTKYMSEFTWTLILRKHVNNFDVMFILVERNLIFMCVVFAMVLLVSAYIIRRGSKSMENIVALNTYTSLASVYQGMFIMNTKKNTVREIKNMMGADVHIFDGTKPLAPQIKMAVEMWVRPEFADELAEFFDFSTIEERLKEKETLEAEFITYKLGWVRARFIPVRDKDEKINYFIFALEIIDAEKKKHELLMRESEEARAASEAKGRFLANMSHEIRTPINAVLGMDMMILRETTEKNIKEYAMNIQNAGRTLLSLINDILDFSKIESGKMEIVPVKYDLCSLLNDVYNMINEKAKLKNLELNLIVDEDIPIGLRGDDVRIRQILVNLLNNAVKYTQEGSVTLKVDGRVEGSEVVLSFSVKDTGIGIKQEDMGKLFQEFERIEESRNRHIEGTGLGMSITVELLKLMDSKLNVTSVYGKGSEFSFELRQEIYRFEAVGEFDKRIVKIAEEFSYEAMFVAPEAKVLVVDDNEMNRNVFAGLLKETKVQIEEAGGGIAALQKLSQVKYDVVFLDHMMPDMDGIQVLETLMQDRNNPNIDTPIIALTANAISGAREEYISKGFKDYLSKPIIPDKLEKKLFKYIPENKKQNAGLVKKEVEATLEDLPTIEGIDWNVAELHLNDRTLLLKTLKMFYSNNVADADELMGYYEQIKAGDKSYLDQYRVKVHSMKSTANLLGIIPLGGMATTLEYAARDEKIQRIIEVTPHFIDSWISYKDKVKDILGSSDTEGKKKISDASEIIDYLNQVLDASENFDVHGADDALEYLKQYEYPSELADMLSHIEVAVNNLDIDSIEKWCAQMVELIQDKGINS